MISYIRNQETKIDCPYPHETHSSIRKPYTKYSDKTCKGTNVVSLKKDSHISAVRSEESECIWGFREGFPKQDFNNQQQ